MFDSQIFGWVCVERAFAVFTDFPGVSASTVAATDVKSLTTWKAMLPFLLSSWQEPAPHTAAPQIYWVRIMSARSPGNSYNEKHWSQWLLLPRFMNSNEWSNQALWGSPWRAETLFLIPYARLLPTELLMVEREERKKDTLNKYCKVGI